MFGGGCGIGAGCTGFAGAGGGMGAAGAGASIGFSQAGSGSGESSLSSGFLSFTLAAGDAFGHSDAFHVPLETPQGTDDEIAADLFVPSTSTLVDEIHQGSTQGDRSRR